MGKSCLLVSSRLTAWFFGPDNGDFYLIAASGAGYIQGNRLLHDALGDRRDDGINVIQTPVQSIKLLGEALDVMSCGVGFKFVLVGQNFYPLGNKVRFIISPAGQACQNISIDL
jgi:hypothetical protein